MSSGRASPVLALPLPLPLVRLSIWRWPGEGCRQGEGREGAGRPHPTCMAGTWPCTRRCCPGTVAANASVAWRTRSEEEDWGCGTCVEFARVLGELGILGTGGGASCQGTSHTCRSGVRPALFSRGPSRAVAGLGAVRLTGCGLAPFPRPALPAGPKPWPAVSLDWVCCLFCPHPSPGAASPPAVAAGERSHPLPLCRVYASGPVGLGPFSGCSPSSPRPSALPRARAAPGGSRHLTLFVARATCSRGRN